ncbi:MAG: alkaline shock response membrane anchor protein AmaP [bacterium]
MRFFFALIGILFDIIILALAGFVIYCAVEPGFLFDQFDLVKPYFEDMNMRTQIGGGALVFFILSFRGVFLLLFSGKERLFAVKRTEHGDLTVSKTTLEHVVSRIAADQTPSASVASIKIAQDGSSLRINLKIKLDLAKCNLGEFIDKFNLDIRGYFKNSLGIELSRLDIQAEAAGAEIEAA